MSKKRTIETVDKSTLPEDSVKLKPFMGIKPGVYLACIYGTVVLVILFFILLYPGISNPGAVLAIKTEPYGAAVLVDGIYMKSAPCEVFVAQGQRRLELSLPGFTPKQIELNIRGKVFASVLFPRKIEVREKLEARSPAISFIDEAAEYAAWTFTGEPGAAYQIPLSLSEGVYRFGPNAADPVIRNSMEDTLTASARFATTKAALRDLLRAKTLLDNQGLPPSPLSLLVSMEDIVSFLETHPGTAAWLAGILSSEDKGKLTASSWYAEATETTQAPSQITRTAIPSGGITQVGPLNFRMIPGGLNLLGDNFPPGTIVDSFYISETVVSPDAWEIFLEQQPRWRKENAVALKAEGLVNEEYLETVSASPYEGISGISWHAAKAFCHWFNLRYTSQETELRLPTEAEWEYAARVMSSYQSNPLGFGRYWEWCEDPYAQLGFISAPAAAVAALASPERSLRGGSWINTPGSVGIETRASLSPSSCSPFVSFRPVLAPRRNEP